MHQLTQAGAASELGFALKVAEARNVAAHNTKFRNVTVLFLPVVIDTLNGCSSDSIALISRIVKLVRVLLLPQLSNICSSASLSYSGKGMQPYGLTAHPFSQLGSMGISNLSFVCQFVCVWMLFICIVFVVYTLLCMFVMSVICIVFVVCMFWFCSFLFSVWL